MECMKRSLWIWCIVSLIDKVIPSVFHYTLNQKGISQEKVEYLFTQAKAVEIDYHVTSITLSLSSNALTGPVWFYLESDEEDVAYPLSRIINFNKEDAKIPKLIHVFGNKVGSTRIRVTNQSSNHPEIKPIKNQNGVQIIVVFSLLLQNINGIIGWLYFLAWSVSFYPQLYTNFKRKSVVGLNFDFLALNLTGFLCYSIFNGGLYYSKAIQDEYFKQFPGSVIPVLPNDVFFAFHAVLITIITIIQCFIYDRGDQSISRAAKVILAIMWAFIIISLIPAAIGKVTWMMYINFLSYVKLAVTLIKYIPQAYMNYKRKSTVGWSIGNVLLDFTGGSLSLLQMFFISYNNDQWNSIFGDFTKFGLGLFSILFDFLFMAQHYILYTKSVMALERGFGEEIIQGFENPHVQD